MPRKRGGDNICYCQVCNHNEAKDCIDLRCLCCIEADQIRLYHITVPADDLSFEEREKLRQDKENENQQKRERDFKNYNRH